MFICGIMILAKEIVSKNKSCDGGKKFHILVLDLGTWFCIIIS